MPPWDQMGVPIHFHSSTISGSAWCTILRTFASIFPRQSPRSLILWSISADASSAGTGLFISSSRPYLAVVRKRRQKKIGVQALVPALPLVAAPGARPAAVAHGGPGRARRRRSHPRRLTVPLFPAERPAV